MNELVERLGLSQPGTSKHLRVLREAGLVSVRRDAQRRLYAVEPAPLAALDHWLAPYRRLWSDRLDALERHLDTTATDTTGSHMAHPSRPADRHTVEPDADYW